MSNYEQMLSEVRPSPIAGSWYPGDPERLRRSIKGYLTEADPIQDVVGLIVPHAGHVYSGATAGKAFSLARSITPDVIVIFSPHHAYTTKTLTTSAYGYYATPLGTVPVDHASLSQFNAKLQEIGLAELSYSRHDQEHAIEIQIPFLQTIYDHPFSLLPLMARDMSLVDLERTVDSLFQVIKDKNCLVISSTDLSHFYSLAVAERLDGHLVSAIEHYDAEAIVKAVTEHGSEACGITGLLAMILLTKKLGGKYSRVVDRSTSADVSGDRTSVVGYASAIVTS